eukprot:1183529-Prorocentrum_minimum.AAC.1
MPHMAPSVQHKVRQLDQYGVFLYSADQSVMSMPDSMRLPPAESDYNITSFYGSSCANNGKDALNTDDG